MPEQEKCTACRLGRAALVGLVALAAYLVNKG